MSDDKTLPPEVLDLVEGLLHEKFEANADAAPEAVCREVAEELQAQGAPFSYEMVYHIYSKVMAL